jgi:hypothetical protein
MDVVDPAIERAAVGGKQFRMAWIWDAGSLPDIIPLIMTGLIRSGGLFGMAWYPASS